MKENNVEMKKDVQVKSIEQNNKGRWIVKTKETEFSARKIALETGRLAAPDTGSTGD